MSIFSYLADNDLELVQLKPAPGNVPDAYVFIQDNEQGKMLISEFSKAGINTHIGSPLGTQQQQLAVVLDSVEDAEKLQALTAELVNNLKTFLTSPRWGDTPLEITKMHVPDEPEKAYCLIPEVSTGRDLIRHLHELGAGAIISNYGGELAVLVNKGIPQLESFGVLKESQQQRLLKRWQAAQEQTGPSPK